MFFLSFGIWHWFLALSIPVLFISLMQSVNGAHFLIIIFFFLLFAFAVVSVFGTSIVLVTSMYT